MKAIIRTCCLVTVLFLAVTGQVMAQSQAANDAGQGDQQKPHIMSATVSDIITNPGRFDREKVEVSGHIMQYVKASVGTTSYYLFKGTYGAVIRVNTDRDVDEATLNRYHTIQGIVYINPQDQKPFISERSRQLNAGNDWMIYALVGALVLLLLVLIGLLFYQMSAKRRGAAAPAQPFVQPGAQGQPEGEPARLLTIKIPPKPKTMRFIPGRLEIMSGKDQGNSLRIAGYSLPNGDSVASIGCNEVSGDRGYAHIKLERVDYPTVSGMHAEFIFRNAQLHVMNKSKVNPTQVNGAEIDEDLVGLNFGDALRLGELELVYKDA